MENKTQESLEGQQSTERMFEISFCKLPRKISMRVGLVTPNLKASMFAAHSENCCQG